MESRNPQNCPGRPTLYLPDPPRQGSQPAYPIHRRPLLRAAYPTPLTQSPEPPTLYLPSQLAYPIPLTQSPERPTLCPPPGRQTPKSPSSVLLQARPPPGLPALHLPSRLPYTPPPRYRNSKDTRRASSTRPTPHTTSLTPKSPTLYPPDLRGRNLLLSPAGLPYTAARPVSKTPNNHRVPR